MAKEWYLMDSPGYQTGFESEDFFFSVDGGFDEILSSPIADDVEIYEKSLEAPSVKTRAIIQGDTSDTQSGTTIRQILCKTGLLRCGQYVRVNGKMWLVSTLPDDNKMYEKAVLWQCRYNLNFISPLTGRVVTYPVYSLNSTQYGSGERDTKHMSVGISQHLVYFPANEETCLLDCGFRFLADKNKINPTAYRVTQVDTASYSCGEDGLLQFTFVESQFDPKTDNKELMVADYYGKSEFTESKPSSAGRMIEVQTPNGKKDPTVIFGETIKLRAFVVDSGNPVPNLPVKFSIKDGKEYGDIVESGTDYCIVRALDNREYIGYEITILCKSEDAALSREVRIRIKGWY